MGLKKDFGPFELHEKIGSGGMASVYLGVQKSLDRPVVLKVLYPHLAEDEKLVTRFEREARAAAFLRHENIVQVIDCGRHDELSYIAMEFVEGLNLKQWIETYGTPPLEMALLMMRDICRGIEHAHHHRVVHRDIKPANIMLTPDGTIKIMDFGLARRGEDSTAVTVVGSVLGTPAYMSPEQATGEQVDERADIFSAGVVGYELLGGQRPFQGDSYTTVLRAVLTVEPPPLENLNPTVPEEVVKIIHRMLQKDPAKRAQSIADVRGDLETMLEQMGLHRGKDLLREYAQDPKRVTEVLRKKRVSRHLDQGFYFENMGLSKIDDALLEYRRVIYLDPANKEAEEHMKALEKQRDRLRAERGDADDKTMVLDPGAGPDATLVMPPGGAPAGTAKAGAKPAPAPAKASRPAERAAALPSRRATPAPASSAGTRNLLIAAAAVLLLVVGTVVTLAVRGGGNHRRGEASASGESGSTSLPPPAATTEAPKPPPSAPPVTPPTVAQTPPEKPAVATLTLTTDPAPAKVIIDGVTQAKRSNAKLDQLSPGPHTVRIEKDGFLAKETQVTLVAGKETPLKLVLDPIEGVNGTLEIKVTPYATFFVNDKQVDANKVSTRQTLKPGRYTIRAEHPAFAPKEWKDILIEPNKTKSLAFDFEESTKNRTGSLGVGCEGGWAYIYLDGRNTGKTAPGILNELTPGSYAVSVVREGFVVEGSAKSVVIRPGQKSEVSFKVHPR